MANEDYVEDPWGAPPTMSTIGVSQRLIGQSPPVRATRKPRLRTSGFLRHNRPGFVYVATAKGAVKIGITHNPDARVRSLRAKLVVALPVVPAAAIDVETMALEMLGRCHLAPSEWVRVPPQEAIDAVRAALDAVGRYRHADPALTEDEARRARIALATANQMV